ncbi:MAG: DOMON-like domain-containing protein [Methylococcaceae bacterium]|jgi:hypothetical protein
MTRLTLSPHPSTARRSADNLTVTLAVSAGHLLTLSYRLEGCAGLLIPAARSTAGRRDGLWQHTCLEAFIGTFDETAYWELNVSPAGDWALYHFTDCRENMTAPDRPAPLLVVERDERDCLTLEASISLETLGYAPTARLQLGLSAVLETDDGALTYWALRHTGESPDFHHPASRVVTLPLPPA